MDLKRFARAKSLWLVLLCFNVIVWPFALKGIHSSDTDMFYHLAAGRYMAEHGRILDREVFSFTLPDKPWTNYHWVFEYLLHRVYALGGFGALIAFRALLVVVTGHIMFYLTFQRADRKPLVALAFSLAAFALYIPRGVNIRSHLVSYLFLALTVWLLDRLSRRPGAFEPWLPLLCILWANLHGIEFPIVLGVIAIYAATALIPYLGQDVGAVLRDWNAMRWPLVLLSCGLAFLVNPFGIALFRTPLMGLNQEVMRFIAETNPYNWHDLFFFHPQADFYSPVTFHYLLLAALFALPVWLAHGDWRAILVTLFGAGLAIQRARFLVEFAILAPPFVAGAFARLQARPGRRGWAVVIALVTAVGYFGVAAAMTVREHVKLGYFERISASAYPVGVASFLRAEGLAGNLFSRPGDAGYIEWSLYPDVRIAMDMRTPEPFPTQIYWWVRSAHDPVLFRHFQQQWPVDLVLVRRQSAQSAIAPLRDLGFVLTYADDRFVLLTHTRKLAGGREHLVLRVLNPFDTNMDYVANLADDANREALRAETQRLIQVWPGNHLAHRTELALRLASGQYAEARAQAFALMTEFPRHSFYPYYAGLALRAEGEPAAAIEEFHKAMRLDPDFEPTYVQLAATAFALARYPLGLEVMERLLKRRRYDMPAGEYLLLGHLRVQVGNWTGAAESYERAMWLTDEESPLRPEVESALGGVYVDLGRFDAALPLLDTALRRAGRRPDAEFNRARAWAKLGRTEAAQRAFEQLAEDQSVHPWIRAQARLRVPSRPRP